MVPTTFGAMSENDRKNANSAMDQIIGNVTAEMQNSDGQYIPLAYSTPSASNIPQDSISWNHQNSYELHYNRACNDPNLYNSNHQFNQPSFNYIQQPSASQHLYVPNHVFNKQNNMNYEIYQNMQGNVSDIDMFDNNYHLIRNQNFQRVPHPNDQVLQSQNISNHTQLIENLVGNWVTPNTSGTYSPFGNTDLYTNKGKIFDPIDNNINKATMEDSPFKKGDQTLDEKFNFNRETRKPRIVAEVKPMRPTYSDVLAKSVPQCTAKPSKNEIKDSKLKKESNKRNKSEKMKPNTPLNRSSTNNELNIKEVSLEKNQSMKNNDKSKISKTGQLDRKWASLDNISEPQSKNNKSRKKEEDHSNQTKNILKKVKNPSNISESETSIKNETYWINKNGVKKGNKINSRLNKNGDVFNGNERLPGKRNQRVKKKDNSIVIGFIKQKLKIYLKGWWKFISVFVLWLYQVISDICSLSLHIGHDVAISCWCWLCIKWVVFSTVFIALIKQLSLLNWIMEKFKKAKTSEKSSPSFTHMGLKYNLPMPTTGEEAMKRLLACKGKDPYSILGVSPTCTDDDIKKYYKKQAVLVHPDKNQQPGAEEAFKILVHAFDMIGVPERRASYDRGVAESAQVEQAWSELTELLAQLQKKVEAAANTIRCSSCGQRHKRIKMDRPIYAARNCSTCKIHHAAREGDIWAEAQCFGFLWHYYACMEGGVYDITDWASCQKDSLKHIKSDSHHVQYRIALGKQNNQTKKASASPRSDQPGLHDLLHTLYGQDIPYQGDMPYQADSSTKKKNKKTK